MEIALLGPLVVTRDGRQLELGGAQPRLLLALLALDPGRVVGADRLVDGIWGEHLPAEPANALQSVASRLRRALAPDPAGGVETARLPVALDPERVDAVRFERHIAAARAAMAAGQAERAATTRLDELRLAALEDRIEVDLGLGRQAQVVGELQSLVEREPLRERLYAQLMRALYATAGVGLQLVAGARGDHLPLVQHDDAVGELVGLLQVLGGEQDGGAVGDQLADRAPQAEAATRVQPAGRLVEEQHLGPTRVAARSRRRRIPPE